MSASGYEKSFETKVIRKETHCSKCIDFCAILSNFFFPVENNKFSRSQFPFAKVFFFSLYSIAIRIVISIWCDNAKLNG